MEDEKIKVGLDYPIWIDKPTKIDITTEQFYNLSYYGLSALWCSFKALFHYTKDGSMMIYTNSWNKAMVCSKSKRFDGIDWYENKPAEMFLCTIPKGHKLVATIEKKFKYLIMEGAYDGNAE